MPDVESLRIPVKYLANLLTAGNEAPVISALKRLLAMRAYKRSQHVDNEENLAVLEEAGLSKAQVEEMYRYLAIANYEDRFVVPTSHKEYAGDALAMRGGCGFTFGGSLDESQTGTNIFGKKKLTRQHVLRKGQIPFKLEE